MSHLDEGTLHALLDGELETNEVAEIQAHLGSCSACGLRLREVKEFLAESDRLIASVDMGRAAAPAAAPREARAEVRDRPDAAPRREPRPPRPERPAERPRAQETWDQPPPEILLPDNESARERRIRRIRRFGWAAIILVLVGAGFAQLSRFGVGIPANLPTAEKLSDRGAVVSPVEASPTDQSTLSRAVETLPSNIAVAETNSAARRTPAPAAKAPPSTPTPAKAAPKQTPATRKAQEQKLAALAPREDSTVGANEDSAALAKAYLEEEKAEKTEAGKAGKDEVTPAGTEDLADVRAKASEALADLDRERRRNQAAAATAALDAERRRATAKPAAGGVATGARTEVAPTPPSPPTPEQRAGVYIRIGLDEASRQLGGPVHVIEGLSPMFMGMAQGAAVGGADATRPVVRVVYQDTQGRLILLDQQRLRPGQPVPQGSALAWTIGDTAMWLHGEAGPDILRTYRPRVR